MSDPAPGETIRYGALRWAVRSSFRAYVAALSDGKERVGDGARVGDDGRIVFTPAPADSVLGRGRDTYAFRGTLAFTGHSGVLSVEFRDPHVHMVAGGRSTVSVAPPSGRTGERSEIAAFVGWEGSDRRLIVPRPRLTWFGTMMLGDVYEVGDLLDPIEIAFTGA
ncbi:HtaA domain-containing protein [Nocardia sp. NPDC019395]|uniref:HtaA domain-containing protein n=1 Tax=Nocardia sp. NPDC019395 TaxID=3154686 RepID=UPI0034092064